METRSENYITFVGEQDGPPERDLKRRIIEALSRFASVRKAYLARVNYGGADQTWVALCLVGASESEEIAAACTKPFQELFNRTDALDVLFIPPEHDEGLAKVCRPFYCR